jgi:hypothetical protein
MIEPSQNIDQGQPSLEYATVESHSCAKNAQKWGTRLLQIGLTLTKL